MAGLGYAVYLVSASGQGARLIEGIRQYDSSDTGHSDNVNIAAEHQEPAEVLSQLDNTSNSPVSDSSRLCRCKVRRHWTVFARIIFQCC